MLKKWEDLPDNMKNDSVRKYYDILYSRRYSLVFKRIFDIIVAILALILLSPIFVILSILIKFDSDGPVFFRQVRITQYGKKFRIFKFRTMVNNADKIGSQVTTKNDVRVTKTGKLLRKLRFDELPQLLNIISGDMTFVGTRPEVGKYVEKYSQDMMATLVLPAGVTSEASIRYKDEEKLLESAENADATYIYQVLPKKMEYNLRSIEKFSFISDIETMMRTVVAVVKREEKAYDSTSINEEVQKIN